MKKFLKHGNRGLLLSGIVLVALIIFIIADYIQFNTQKDEIKAAINNYYSEIFALDTESKTIDEAIALYDKNKALLKLGSKYCTDDNMKALNSLASSLNDKDFAKGLELLSGTNLDAVIESLPEVSKNLEKIA